jgi:hypothetical protein
VRDHGLVDLIDDGVQGVDCRLRDLTKQDLVVVRGLGINCLVHRSPNKVDSFAFKLDFFTISNEKFGTSADLILNLSRLVDLVSSLIIDEDSGGSHTSEEVIEGAFVFALEDFFRNAQFIDFECICNK